jgi:hypothetical protein
MIDKTVDLVLIIGTAVNTGFLVVIYDRLKWRK